MKPDERTQQWPGSVAPPTFTLTPVRDGDCYQNAFDFVEANAKHGWALVHGIPLGTGGEAKGRRYGHAWAESTSSKIPWAYDPSADALLPAALYRREGDIEYAVTYDEEAAIAQALETGHYGPWDATIADADHNHDDDDDTPPAATERPGPRTKVVRLSDIAAKGFSLLARDYVDDPTIPDRRDENLEQPKGDK